MRFTRYLYEVEDVKCSLTMSILKSKLEETLFWVGELYYSELEREMWLFLYEIYYNFYYIFYSRLERTIQKMQKEASEISVFTVAKTLCKLSHATTHVFELEKLTKLDELDVNYIYKTSEKLNIGSKMLKSIKYHHIINIAYYIKKANKLDILSEMEAQISSYINVKLPNIDENLRKIILLSRISKSIYIKMVKSLKIVSKTISQVTREEINKQHEINKLDGSLYTMLERKRIYEIDDDIGLTIFERYIDNDEKQKNLWLNWEYFAYNVPIWKKRIEKYKGFPSEQQTIEFENDDIAEEFYQCYSFDPDEQSSKTNNKAIKIVKQLQYSDWIDIIKLKQ